MNRHGKHKARKSYFAQIAKNYPNTRMAKVFRGLWYNRGDK